jgi:hypothetical protein
MPTNLIGIDVGFSVTRPTTGIACLEGNHLTPERAGTAWESREAKIPKGFQPSLIAIDGPSLPVGADQHIRRQCRVHFHSRSVPQSLKTRPQSSWSGIGAATGFM